MTLFLNGRRVDRITGFSHRAGTSLGVYVNADRRFAFDDLVIFGLE